MAAPVLVAFFDKDRLDGCPFVPKADLDVDITVAPETAPAGTSTEVTYTIVVTNDGTVPGSGVVVDGAVFPPFFTVDTVDVSSSDPGAAPVVESTDPFEVRIPVLPAGATVTITVRGSAFPKCGDEAFTTTVDVRATNAITQSGSATLSVGDGSAETCDGIDNDCDGQVDENGAVLCNDGNACTTDACSDGTCTSTPIDGCTACSVDGDCNDGNTCTTDACTGGVCTATPIGGCTPCSIDGDAAHDPGTDHVADADRTGTRLLGWRGDGW